MIRRLYLLILFNLFLFFSNAQELEWENTIGGSQNDNLSAVGETFDGGYILGGISLSPIGFDKTVGVVGGYDYWIVKLDSSGQIQWQKTIGGSGNDRISSKCLKQTTDSGYILGGFSNSGISGDKTENNIGGNDFWIIKLDSSGVIQWQNTIGGSNDEILTCIELTRDGGYLLGGGSWSSISGDKTENIIGAQDFWIVKIDSIGNIQWQNTIGGTQGDFLVSVHQTFDGGYFLGGYSSSSISGDKTEDNRGLGDYWVIKVDSLGNIIWQRTIGGASSEVLNDVQPTSDGGYLLGGYSRSNISGEKTDDCKGGDDYWIIKLDSTGNILWQKTIGGSSVDRLYSMIQTASGGFILAGITTSNASADKSEDQIGNDDLWIVKIDATGSVVIENTIGGVGDDKVPYIIQSRDGGYVVASSSDSNRSTDKSENSIGHFDYWVIKLTENYNGMSGKLFIDLNSNSIQDPGELPVLHQPVIESNTGRRTYSRGEGDYFLTSIKSGNFTASAALLPNFTAMPAQHITYFSGFQQVDSLNDFAYQPTSVVNDLLVRIVPLTAFRPGFDVQYNIFYKNVGTTSLSGTIVFFPDNGLTFISATVSPNSVTPDSIVWITPTLTPFQEGMINVIVHVDPGLPLGTITNSLVRIEPIASDVYPNNNQSSHEVAIVGSYDPNDILVNTAILSTDEVANSPYLEYIIRFQNTGTDTAFNVRVSNRLPEGVDANSFEFLNASHPVNLRYLNQDRIMWFEFDQILLADSNVDEAMSHGFVSYRIKTLPSLAAGDTIKNYAHIYFDYNNPVRTNDAITNIVLPDWIPGVTKDNFFSVYPNPANENVRVSFGLTGQSDVKLEVYDLMGRRVKGIADKALSSGNQEIDFSVTGLVDGVYQVRLSIDGSLYTRKLFVQKD